MSDSAKQEALTEGDRSVHDVLLSLEEVVDGLLSVVAELQEIALENCPDARAARVMLEKADKCAEEDPERALYLRTRANELLAGVHGEAA